jgi:hypothetical protein
VIPPLFTFPRKEWAILEHPEGYLIGPYSGLTLGDMPFLVQTCDSREEASAWVESSFALEDMP